MTTRVFENLLETMCHTAHSVETTQIVTEVVEQMENALNP
jgi:hypothetical protein